MSCPPTAPPGGITGRPQPCPSPRAAPPWAPTQHNHVKKPNQNPPTARHGPAPTGMTDPRAATSSAARLDGSSTAASGSRRLGPWAHCRCGCRSGRDRSALGRDAGGPLARPARGWRAGGSCGSFDADPSTRSLCRVDDSHLDARRVQTHAADNRPRPQNRDVVAGSLRPRHSYTSIHRRT